MSFGVSGINGGQQLYSLQQAQQGLATSFERLSSGKQINTAADNPSGLAIANALQAQVNAYNEATGNVQTALNATTVASGAVGTVSDILGTLNNLAVQASSDLLNPTDRAAIQAQANQLVQEANFVAQNTTFNGIQLLNGQYAGAQAGTPAQAQVTNNDQLNQGGGVITSVTAANAQFNAVPNGPPQGLGGTSTTNSTIQVQITTDANGNPVAVATLYDNASGQSVQSAAVGPGGTISGLENVNINVGNFTAADVGTTATIQIQAATAANTQNSALVVQSGPNQGATTNVNLPAVNSSQLAISNLDFSTTLSATNAIGQVQNALTQIEQTQANLGAQQVSLGYAVNNNNIAANNLTTSLSAIQDTNYPSETTNATKNNLLAQINVAVLAQRNNQAASIVGLFTGH